MLQKFFASFLLVGLAMAPPVMADTTTDKLVAGDAGQQVCDYFDANPVTESSLFKFVNDTAARYNLNGDQTADLTMAATLLYCPEHYGPIMKIAQDYVEAHGTDSGQGGKSRGKLIYAH